jgi:ribonuclease Z
VRYPAGAHDTIERLRHATPYRDRTEVVLHPEGPGRSTRGHPSRSWRPPCRTATVHPVPTLGWRLEEPDGRGSIPVRLARFGVPPGARRELVDEGHVTVDGRGVELEEVSDPRRGQVAAVVMDTRDGDGARACAEGADLLVIEATFLEDQRDLAEEAGHLTAAQAARSRATPERAGWC